MQTRQILNLSGLFFGSHKVRLFFWFYVTASLSVFRITKLMLIFLLS